MRKKIFTCIVAMALLFSGTPCLANSAEESIPFTPLKNYTALSAPEDLLLIEQDPDGKFYLQNDIIIPESYYEEGGLFYNDGNGWQCLCRDNGFSGVLDGRNHTIGVLKSSYYDSINSSGCFQNPVALFKANSGYILRLSISVDYNISYTFTVGGSYSAFCYENSGEISDCKSKGSIYITPGEEPPAQYNTELVGGGFCCDNSGTIERCQNNISFEALTPKTIGRRSCLVSFGGVANSNSGYIGNCQNNSILINNIIQNKTIKTVMLPGIAEYNSGTCKNCCNFGVSDCSNTNVVDNNSSKVIGCVTIVGNNKTADNNSGVMDVLLLDWSELSIESEYVGWDFENIWEIKADEYYPSLRTNNRNLSAEYYDFERGDGTEQYPFEISNAKQFSNIYLYPMSCFVLTQNISLSDWEPPYSSVSRREFSGILDGAGYALEDYSNNDLTESATLWISNSGTIKNLSFVNVQISAPYTQSLFAQNNYGTIENCHVSGEIALVGDKNERLTFGTFACANIGQIINCSCNASLSFSGFCNDNEVGGIASTNQNLIKDCDSYGQMVADHVKIGAIFGGICSINTSCVTGSTCSADIVLQSTEKQYLLYYVGGLVGQNNSFAGTKTEISNCCFLGTITVKCGNGTKPTPNAYTLNIGGICAINQSNSVVTSSYCAGTAEWIFPDDVYVGGAVAKNEGTVSAYTLKLFSSDSGENGMVLSAKQMKNRAELKELDFENTWKIEGTDFLLPQYKHRQIRYSSKPIGIEISALPCLRSYFAKEEFDFSDMAVAKIMNNGAEIPTDQWQLCNKNDKGTLRYGANTFTVVYNDEKYSYYKDFDINILETMQLGDMNADGFVMADDVVELYRYLLDNSFKTHTIAADVNADGKIDLRDFVRLKKVLAAY